jgi:serine/threonine protein kinase
VNARIVADRFELQSSARSGGMGVVYRARDTATGSSVALKLLRADVDEQQRFEREARLLAGLQHPAIVRYVAHGVTPQGELFLAMEWLDGEDLLHGIARQRLTVEETLFIARRIAAALAVAHARGVVHRDVKPGNIFLPAGAAERATLLDSGIARSARESLSMTTAGIVLGTPAYMAPEQGTQRHRSR